MTAPGFTAYVCVDHPLRASRPVVPVRAPELTDAVVPQLCATTTLAACSVWLEACFFGPCWWARAFGGPSACTSCMAGCLAGINPAMWPLCVECAGPRRCTNFTSFGCPHNICA
jgi:hypothetical protein